MTRQRDAGFTVIEALVAAVVFGVTFFTLYNGLTGAWRGVRAAHAAELAFSVAKSRLAAAGIEAPLKDGDTFDGETDGTTWRMTVGRYGDTAAEASRSAETLAPYLVTVDVNWSGSLLEKSQELHLSTVKLGPKP